MKKLLILLFVVSFAAITGCDADQQQNSSTKEISELIEEEGNKMEDDKETRVLFPNIFTPIVEILIK